MREGKGSIGRKEIMGGEKTNEEMTITFAPIESWT